MSINKEGAVPMEEEQVPLDSSITESTMDWEKVDEKEVAESEEQEAHPITQSEKIQMTSNTSNNFDEYSFGSSDDDDEVKQDDELEKMAHVSLDTEFDMTIVRTSIEKSEDAINLVEGKDVVMVVGKTGVGKSTLIQVR